MEGKMKFFAVWHRIPNKSASSDKLMAGLSLLLHFLVPLRRHASASPFGARL